MLKELVIASMLGMGLLVGGCGSNTDTPHLVQLDNGKYCMSSGDDYGVEYIKGWSDDEVTNYKMIRVIGKDDNTTVDDFVKCYKDNGLKGALNVQYIGEAVEYKGDVYKAVYGNTHVCEGQKYIITSEYKDEYKITIDGEFKSWALAEVTKVERDDSGHLTHYTLKIVKDMKIVKGDVADHFEVNK